MTTNAHPGRPRKGTLELTLKDGRNRFVTSRTAIVLRDEISGMLQYRTVSKAGEARRFHFEVAPGVYVAEVRAKLFEPYFQPVRVRAGRESAYEFRLKVATVARGDEDDAELVRERFEWFAAPRAYPLEQFPSDLRKQALDQKRQMPQAAYLPPRIQAQVAGAEHASKTTYVETSKRSGGAYRRGWPERRLPASANTAEAPAPPMSQKAPALPQIPAPIAVPGCNWLPLGPRNINGRIRALAIHPTDANTVYAGSANAGVWVTSDAGKCWTPLMHDQDALEIGALCTHLTNPAAPAGAVTIYAGTGEPTWEPGYAGIGVLKSIDGGTTWTATGTIGNERHSVILVDPTSLTANPAATVVYAGGTPGGLYKSTNGGATWTPMLAKEITGLAMDPTNPDVLYAAVKNEGIFRYDPLLNAWNAFNAGFPTPFPLLCLIAICPAAPYTKYAKLDQKVYVFDENAGQWKSIGQHGGETYGFWNNVLAVDPTAADIVFAGGAALERSSDGGKHWTTIGALHEDQHALVFDPGNHLKVYAGNDGGVFHGVYTQPNDSGTWTDVSNGLIITQFYQVGASPLPSLDLDILGGGSQDNGTNLTTGGLTYANIYGGDGGFLIFDPAAPQILYFESQNGGIAKSINGGNTFEAANTGFPGGPFVTPIVLDPHSPPEPNRVLFAGGSAKKGTNQVYRSTDSAQNWSSCSPDLGGQVIAIAIAPSTSAIVYAVTDSGSVWRSSDGGATFANWTDITGRVNPAAAPLPQRAATDVAVHPSDPDTVFVTFSGTNSATPSAQGHVFRGSSTDGWQTWRWDNLSSNLPDTPTNAIQVSTDVPNTLYIGTDVGVFRTTNGGGYWQDFGAGLPNVVVADIAFSTNEDALRAATYGWGIWEIELNGACPPVDVFIRDNHLDNGETVPSPHEVADPTVPGRLVHWWESADIKIDAFPYLIAGPLSDGIQFDQFQSEQPIASSAHPNHLYVQVHNRGPLSAHNVKVKVLYTDGSSGFPPLPADFWTNYPNDWVATSEWKSVDASTPFRAIPELAPSKPGILMWNWVLPAECADPAVLAVISADEDPVQRSDANPNDQIIASVVPDDKHLALLNVQVRNSLLSGGQLELQNQAPFPQFFDLAVSWQDLPKGTTLEFSLHPKHKQKAERLQERTFEQSIAGRLLIPPGRKLRAKVAISDLGKTKAGGSYRFSVLQKTGDALVGGITYEIRIPPAEIFARYAATLTRVRRRSRR
jgi:photosystem II stability/assembly factor-like uncharacterized protein